MLQKLSKWKIFMEKFWMKDEEQANVITLVKKKRMKVCTVEVTAKVKRMWITSER